LSHGPWTQRQWIVQEQLLNQNVVTTMPLLFWTGLLPAPAGIYKSAARINMQKGFRWDQVASNTYSWW
jgi:hypothetical protein